MNLNLIKEKIFNSKNISANETKFIFDLIMNGEISEVENDIWLLQKYLKLL